jgi:hypothetical protein
MDTFTIPTTITQGEGIGLALNWNEKPASAGDCPIEGLFCGVKTLKSKAGKEFEVISLDNAKGSYWLPLFKVRSANVGKNEVSKLTNSHIKVLADGDMFTLEFSPI